MIRPAKERDLDRILQIYADARVFMREHGNPDQWGTDKPRQERLEADIQKGELYVGTDDDGKIHFVFSICHNNHLI